MTHTELFGNISAGIIANTYLFTGDEELVKGRALQRLREALLPAGLEAVNETVLDGAPAERIIEAAETMPFMAQKRLVVARDFAPLISGKSRDEMAEAARMAEYLPGVPDYCCLVFYVRGSADGRKKLTGQLGKLAQVVNFTALDDAELFKWIRQTLSPLGKTIDHQTAQALSFTAGRGLMALEGELEKLAAYASGITIRREDIEKVVTPTLECTIFHLIDNLVAQDAARTMRMLSAMLEAGEGYIGILAMLTRQFQMLGALKALGSAPSKAAVAALGYNDYAAKRAREQARAFGAAPLRSAYRSCVLTDYAIKSGHARDEVAIARLLAALLRLKKQPELIADLETSLAESAWD